MISPAKIAALFHGELETREGGKEAQRFIRREAIEEFVGREHGLKVRWDENLTRVNSNSPQGEVLSR